MNDNRQKLDDKQEMIQLKKTSREAWFVRTMETLMQDLRHACRSLIREPVFPLAAIVALALGFGMNTAIFSVVNAVLLKPLPYPEPDRLVWMAETGDVPDRMLSYFNFNNWRDRNTVFEAVSTYRTWPVTLTGFGEAENIVTQMVAGDYFKVMHAFPSLGRTFTVEDEKTNAQVTVVSNDFWRDYLSSDPNAVGKTITLDDLTFTVIGALPKDFKGLESHPLYVLVGQKWAPGDWEYKDTRTAGYVVARLKPGVNFAQAETGMDQLMEQMTREMPFLNKGNRVEMMPLYDHVTGASRKAILLLFVAVALVLLIACTNVANLMMARAATRQREFAVRLALGAGRWRIIRQLLTENVILAIVGGCVGLFLAWGSVYYLAATQSLPRMAGLSVDIRVLGFTALVALITGLLFGIAPAIQMSGVDLGETLKEGGHTSTGGHKIRSALIIFEVAVSLMLLIGSGLLIKSLLRLVNSDTGFDPNNVVTMVVAIPHVKYDRIIQRTEFHRQLIERVSALPGIEHVGVSVNLPGFTDGWQNDIAAEGYGRIKPGELLNVDWAIVSDGFFDTMKIPLLQGRTFTRQEAEEGKYVVVVDETLAKRFWPDGEAIGKHIAYDDRGWQEIIGVTKRIDYFGSELKPRMKIYTPIGKNDQNRMYLSVRSSQANSPGIVNAISAQAHELDKDVSISDVATMNELLSREASPKRFNTILFGVFAAVALVLAAVGIYGVMSYTVSQRTHELGIRMALGAQGIDVLKLVIVQGMRRIIIGLGIGLVGAFALTRVMKALLFGVSATDPMTFIGVTLVITLVALLACYIPARRVTMIDPSSALRVE